MRVTLVQPFRARVRTTDDFIQSGDLVLKPGQNLDRDAMIGYCAERLARFKLPHDIAIIEVLPRNATGKVLKRELRKRFLGRDAPAIS